MISFRISHPHGSPEGENSTYVFPERGVVIDPGPPGEQPWDVLRTGMKAQDFDMGEVDHIILTHWHSDHVGNAPRLAEAADATLHMHEQDAPLLRDYWVERQRRVERDTETLELWGAPTEIITDVRENDTPSPIPDTVPVTGHTDGDMIRGLELLHTPGHTRGHLSIRSNSTLYVGDAVLPMYTPNVGGSDTRTATHNPLEQYFVTLDRIAELDVAQEARPGHGSGVRLNDRIEAIRVHHGKRVDAVVDALPSEGGATPWTIARKLFGDMSGIHAKMGTGEAAAHLSYAAQSGQVTRLDDEPLTYRRL